MLRSTAPSSGLLAIAALIVWVCACTAGHLVGSPGPMERLAAAELVRPIRKGLWSLERTIDPYLVAGCVVAPYPAYVSLWSALYLRELIEQIPSSIYVASVARAQEIRTTVATYSIHHLTPELFGGFEVRDRAASSSRSPKRPSSISLTSPRCVRAASPRCPSFICRLDCGGGRTRVGGANRCACGGHEGAAAARGASEVRR